MNANHAPLERLSALIAALALAGCTGSASPTSGSPDASPQPSMPVAVPTLVTAIPSATDVPPQTAAPSVDPGTSPEPAASLPAPSGAWRPAPTQFSLTA